MSKIQRRLPKWIWGTCILACVALAILLLVSKYHLLPPRPSTSLPIARTRLSGRSLVHREKPARIPVSLQQLAKGRRAIREAVDLATQEDCYAIIVDKSAYNLMVYHGDSLVVSFPVELGGDPINPKERLGDGRTPEGSYQVTWRRDIGETIYHRALLLNYPNRHDRQAGRTGSHIEIHGYGTGLRPDDGGLNWTDGCVALSNSHVDSLFAIGHGSRKIGKGTPVTIVYAGSLQDDRYAVRDP